VKNNYGRFGLMVLTSTIIMLILMYFNTYSFDHVFLSETRFYMDLLMGAVMAIVMLAFMQKMYANKKVNLAFI